MEPRLRSVCSEQACVKPNSALTSPLIWEKCLEHSQIATTIHAPTNVPEACKRCSER